MRSSYRLFAFLCSAALLAAGCDAPGRWPHAAAPDRVETVPAEFAKLDGKTVALVVWTEPATLLQFPHMRLELAAQVAYQLRRHVPTVAVVPPEQVAQYQDRNLHWDALPPTELGRRFGADYVLFVELTDYSTREPKTPTFYRGRARAAVVVHDVNDPSARWTLGLVAAEHPPGRTGLIRGDDVAVHRQLLEILGARIAMKFYDHEVSPRDTL